MDKVRLKQGDYVDVRHLNEQLIHRLVAKFVEAGAVDYDEGRPDASSEYPYLIWDFDNDVWCAPTSRMKLQGKRELHLSEVLDSSSTDKWDGNGQPAVGNRVRIVTAEGDRGCADVIAHHNGGVVVWQHSDMEYQRWHPEFLHPLPTRKEQEIEELIAIMRTADDPGMLGYARALYRAGCRVTEVPNE